MKPRRRDSRVRGSIRTPERASRFPNVSARFGPLDHPADTLRARNSTPPLMRTVSGDRITGTRQSPVVRSRATYRSRRITPAEGFKTLSSPQLTERSQVCARRSIRREVLFAIKATGRGSGSGKRRRTPTSKMRC